MIDRLVQILAAASRESPDAAELADALWLADHIPRRTTSVSLPADTVPSHLPPASAGSMPAATSPPTPLAGLYLTESPDQDSESIRPDIRIAGRTGALAGVPAIPAITSAAAITRALRPLRNRVDGMVRGLVDEDATARNIADTGLWLPHLLPSPARWMDLVLVVDDSASMRVWRRTVDEFRRLLIQLAAFRDIRTVIINTDEDDARIPGMDGSSGRRLMIVLTDCVGRAWTQGVVLRGLEAAQRLGPVAILQMLPQRLWTGCALPFVPIRISRQARETAPPRMWDRTTGEEVAYRIPGPSGVAIPVLELDARWLAPWAAMLAGQANGPIPGMAVFTRAEPIPVQQHERLSGPDRVRLFRSVASPRALRLATYLAAAPLSLPVMRLVQHVMLPRSRPADLAEVFLSGLLRRVSDAGPGTTEFDFEPGVRKVLLSGLRRAEAVRVYRLVSAYVDKRLGSGPEFPAVFGPLRAEESEGTLTSPFGAVALTVLRSVGGQYREIADKLVAAQGNIALPDPSFIAATTPAGGPAVAEQPVVRPPALWRGVPPRNPNFTGRDDLLLALRSQLSQEHIAALVPIALHGLGGVGKTQAAIEYVHRFAADYDLICWIPSEFPIQLRNGLAALAPELKIPAGGDVDMTLTAVCDALNRGEPYSKWLLVVDNADEPDQLMPFLPQAGGHILITSRNQKWTGYAKAYPVAEFTREESISLIRLRRPDVSVADANRLAKRLGDLPIAVEQAVTWQKEAGMSVQTYLDLLDRQMMRLLSENPPEGYGPSIVAAWTLAFEDLERQSPEGAALVQLCSFLGPDPIPYALLWAFRRTPNLPPALENMLQDEISFYRAIRQATQRALLKADPGRETLVEHRLVQAVFRERLSAERQAEQTRLVWQMLVAANPGRPDDPSNWNMLATINSHMTATGLMNFTDRNARAAIIDQIRYLYSYGDQSSSRELAEEAVTRWRESPGPSDGQTLIACRLLGIAWRELGRVDEARTINEDTLNRTRVVYGDDDEHTLVTANSYSCDLRIAGAYAEALDRDQILYAQHQSVFGENEEATFRSAHNLAIDMRLNGRFRDAYELDMDNLRRRREVLGDQRWETWSSAGAVGRDLRGLGEYERSELTLREAIERCGELLGREHPEVIRMRMDHAATLRHLGNLAGAIEEAESCLELNLRRLGEQHNYTLSTMTTLAQALRLAGDDERAHSYAGRVLDAAPETYGPNHSLVGTCMHNYAITLRALGDNDHAYRLDQRVNSQHPSASNEMSLARDLELAGNDAAAEEKLRVVLEVYRQTTAGAADLHPRTLFTAANLARLLRARGNLDEANEINTRTMPALREVLGSRHPEVGLAQSSEFIEFEMEIPDR